MKLFNMLAVGCVLLVAAPVAAQTRVYDQGPVVQVSMVDVEPGQLNAYMADLNRVWRRSMEEGKRRGEILDYQILENMAPGREEADLVLVVTYKNAAVMDTPLDELDRRTAALQGSLEAAQAAQVARGKVRTIMGRGLYRELTFK